MTRRRTLMPLGTADHDAQMDADPAFEAESAPVWQPEPQEQFWDESEPEQAVRARGEWIMPVLAVVTIIGWTAFFVWANWRALVPGTRPDQWIAWISTWSMPVLLVVGLWLLAMRHSRREANRFTRAARSLAHESAQLEARLGIVNRELAIARDFIASQSRDLESLGRLANERLSANADRLQTLIHDNHAQVEAIGTVSDTALANMTHLRDQLPVVANAARDMSNQIGNAGNVAQSHIEGLIAGFERLNQFGEVSESHIDRISERVGSTLELFDHQMTALGESTEERFARLRAVSEGFRADLAMSQEEAIASIRTRAAAISEELRAHDLTQREIEAAALTAMRDRLAALQADGARLLLSLGEGRDEAIGRWGDAIAGLELRMTQAVAEISRVDEAAMRSARTRLAELAEEAHRVDRRIADSLGAFDADIARRHEVMAAREARELAALEGRFTELDAYVRAQYEGQASHAAGMAEQTELLAQRLGAIDADMQRLADRSGATGEALSQSATILAERVEQSRALLQDSGTVVARLTDDSVRLLELIRAGADHSSGALADSIESAEQRLARFAVEATRVHALIGEAEGRGASLSSHVDAARDGSAASLEALAAMEARIGVVADESERLARRTGDELREALAALSTQATAALEGLRTDQQHIISEIADRITEDSRDRIADAIGGPARAAIADLEDAVARATQTGADTSDGLLASLTQVDSLVGSLEQRIEHARERAQERVGADFSRRMALITEALNSSAIDIAKAFENEVSDTQWANYLRGDRGIFTRRAVRLLDKHESRAVAEVYAGDSEFRETVNRYIHDFEAMLREVLSTRDGNTLAVTLLSSEVGKLYVALAQAIDRLRN